VDMLAYAIDNQAPSTIVLISGDRDFAYGLAMLRLRHYRVVLITLSNAHPSLRAQASLCYDWISDVLEHVDPTLLHQPIPLRHGKTSSPPAHDKFDLGSNGHNPSRYPSQESYDEKPSNVEFMNYFQDAKGRKEISRTPLKHDARHDFLPPDLDQSKRQPTVSSLASSTLCNGPETSARVIYSPVASSYHTYLNGSMETPVTMTSRDSNSSKPTPNMSIGSTPKLASYGSAMPSRFSALGTLRGSANLAQNDVARVPEPVSFESATRILRAEPDLRGSSALSQQGAYNTKPQSALSFGQMNDDGDNGSDAAHSDICPPPNVTLLSSLNNATASPVAQSSVEAASPLQPPACPRVPYKFRILVRCLKAHRLQGRIRLLRSKIALEIACNGATYRQAGVFKFCQYVAMAAEAGIVELGGSGLVAWIALREPWCNAYL
jgi:hypothetical protein